ncbi:hypothetical protein [Paraburkholderia aspalathi]|uniref:hypothetical protein n=1 Tax=Paraburkholderia aspalathi TaxID=1324617 RepID=UPI001160C9BE|nr:hypothetical protein [Paraburkholderia aspalathi]
MEWTPQVVPMSSSRYGVSVKGVSHLWKTITIGASKYPNSDFVNSVSRKAENLVPKRIGQIAGIVAADAPPRVFQLRRQRHDDDRQFQRRLELRARRIRVR